MEDFKSSLKDTYPDSFIPGLSQLQANMLGFLIGTFIFILLILLNWALIYTEKKRNRHFKRRTSKTGKENYQRISNSSSCESIFKKNDCWSNIKVLFHHKERKEQARFDALLTASMMKKSETEISKISKKSAVK